MEFIEQMSRLDGAPAFLVLFDLLFFLILFLLVRGTRTPPCQLNRSRYNFVFVLIFVFCMFSFWGADWFGYLRVYNSIKSGNRTHLEEVYIWAIENLCTNYYQFRLMVWGCACVLLYVLFKRVSTNENLLLLFFCTFSLIWFSYGRVSLAMAMMYSGASMLAKPNKGNINVIYFVIGIILVASSYYFHKSSVFGIVTVSLAVITQIYKSKLTWIWLLLYPLLLFLTRNYIADFMALDSSDDAMIVNVDAGQDYMNKAVRSKGVGPLIMFLLEKIPYFMIAYLSLKLISGKLMSNIPNDIALFARITIYGVIFSSLFLFNMGVNTQIVFERFIRFMYIPATIVWAFAYEHRLCPKLTKNIFTIALVSSVYALTYIAYTRL